jgi:high-affinity iron transporter
MGDVAPSSAPARSVLPRRIGIGLLALAGLVVLSILVWQGITADGNPDPTAAHITPAAAILNTGILVFREGLECILVLAAIVASMLGSNKSFRRPIAVGAAGGFAASVITWFAVVGILTSLATNVPSLSLQAATGLLAVVVLVVIMNWFFHRVYWTGWISMHNRRKRELLQDADAAGTVRSSVLWGLAVLGFTSVYREGFEVVLFLQSLRLQVGSLIVLEGVLVGLVLSGIVGVLTFIAHQRLPYKRMLVLTGILLGGVLLVMIGEEAQEMQLAGWISTTPVSLPIPDWAGLWFAVIPTVETLVAQAVGAVLVIGSYFLARYFLVWRPQRRGEAVAERPETPPATQPSEVALAGSSSR